MNPRRTTLTAALCTATAAAVCAALAGCSTQADAAPITSVTPTGTATNGGTSAAPSSSTATSLDAAAQEAKDRHDAEAVWYKVDALRGTVQSMPVDQVTPALTAVAIDPALSRLQEQNTQSRAQGKVGYGTDIHYISWAKPINGRDTAVLDDCSDGSQSGLMDAKTGNKLTVGTPNTPVQVTLKRTEQGWKVASAELVAGVTCTPERPGDVMRTRKPSTLLLGAMVAAAGQGIFIVQSAAACTNPGTPDCPSVSVTPGRGLVDLSATAPGSPGSNSGQPGSGGSGGSAGSGGSGGSSGRGSAVPVADTSGGTPAPPPTWILTCGPVNSSMSSINQGGPVQGVSDIPAAQNCTAAPQTPAAPGAPAPVITAAQLAQAAYGLLRMPSPKPSHYPNGILKENGHPYTLVNANTWFWTDPSTWKPISRTVSAGAVSATATATPTTLGFTPGDGGHRVTCPGPGTEFKATVDTWVSPENPQGCSYRYPNSSYGVGGDDQVTATYTITWNVTWSGSDGTGGTFNNLQTDTTSRFSVAELQTVVTR